MAAAARTRVDGAVRLPPAIVLCLTVGIMTLVWFAAPVAAHDKTDVVTLKNGDRFTGEIKGVAQEALEFDTDAAGTIKLEWPHIASITSSFTYEVEVTTGERFFGSFEASGETGEIQVVGDDGEHTIPLSEVFSITPIGRGFWKRLNVTGESRFRAQLNVNLTWTIINNFNLGISLLDSYDSRPPTVESEKNDLSLSLSVGYSY